MTAAALRAFNDLDADTALATTLAICASPVWARALVAGRPYPAPAALLELAHRELERLSDTEFATALAGHPRIGDRTGGAMSRREQSGMADADSATRAELRRLNRRYEQRHGQVYLVDAAGRSAAELLAILTTRIDNDTAAERAIARRELGAINRNRLRLLLAGAPAPDPRGVDRS
ncbi:2-oxo-4-hydroxy-4-carboxy-5-ureidoimidazoline decarboxylase [Nocardia sp. NPDC051750]|uniref:2-oxo-4-hydroxy-4-carboxy-5-ureidoimidazoline decarboxylase n=1 Tax=Nocardia sp. NPDC051750 TaxID=3364325 RepID=UPI003791B78C